jgi:hypothetical protein
MSITSETRLLVRQRASFACEFCGVTETDTGGELTVDHFHPKARGGADDISNLLYGCVRCNLYKADYWPTQPDELRLWNPRQESVESHLLMLVDGSLYPITLVGEFTLTRLRLNRPSLIAYRLRKQYQAEQAQLYTRYREIVAALERLHEQQMLLLEEHRALLNEQRNVLRLLLDK